MSARLGFDHAEQLGPQQRLRVFHCLFQPFDGLEQVGCFLEADRVGGLPGSAHNVFGGCHIGGGNTPGGFGHVRDPSSR